MSTHLSGRQAELRSAILDFLSERLNSKLDKLADDDPKRVELQAQFTPAAWLEDAARRVAQIQSVTHSLKPIHPDAKGSSLFCVPDDMPTLDEVGSHSLGLHFEADVVGNAAALDVYKFLKLAPGGRSLLSLCEAEDADLAAAFGGDADAAQAWMQAFASLAQPAGKLSSHTLAKQVYWPVGVDLHDDTAYHLLAPLYPTSLVHRVYQTLQNDRFSDEAKAAREARKAGTWHERPVREYPNLAIQKLGGTKPQNISQLNSERRGDNCLLASVPPLWQAPAVQPVLNTDSFFSVFRRRRDVRTLVTHLKRYLESDPASNLATRTQRDQMVEQLLDELMQFTGEQHTLDSGWTADPLCELPAHQATWLDPDGAAGPPDDQIDRLAADFAHWLNAQLRNPLPIGDPEYLHWRKQAREAFKQVEREGLHEPE